MNHYRYPSEMLVIDKKHFFFIYFKILNQIIKVLKYIFILIPYNREAKYFYKITE